MRKIGDVEGVSEEILCEQVKENAKRTIEVAKGLCDYFKLNNITHADALEAIAALIACIFLEHMTEDEFEKYLNHIRGLYKG